MKISIAQLNYHIGNFDYNKSLICNAIREAKAAGADLIVFSELCISGYPPLDLLDRYDFIEKCNKTVIDIAAECHGITALVGAPEINNDKRGKKLFNSVFALSEGRIIFSARKALLPTYDIFDEYRYFESGKDFNVFLFKGKKIAVTICEDLWDDQLFENRFEKSRLYTVSPMEELAKQQPDIVVNMSASPFSYTKIETRTNIFKDKACKYGIPIVAVNQVGANTELIFDGSSVAIASNGIIYKKLPSFEESILTFDLDELTENKTMNTDNSANYIELIHNALILGIKDYFKKSGFRKAVLGLSGGIDSAVSLYLAAKALGADNVRSLLMPSRYSSESSVTDAIELSNRLGTQYDIIDIETSFRTFEEGLAPIFKGKEIDVAEENIQARIRAIYLMAVSNKFGCMLLNTSNKSEAAVGYGTLYGDMAGGLSVIGDVYKTDIYKLAAYINRENEIIPQNIIQKLPSAELRPNQLDSDSLPDYDMLDNILYQYIELQTPVEEIIKHAADEETVYRVIKLINSSEYKRYQAPPVLRISSKAFGAGRRMPLAAKY